MTRSSLSGGWQNFVVVSRDLSNLNVVFTWQATLSKPSLDSFPADLAQKLWKEDLLWLHNQARCCYRACSEFSGRMTGPGCRWVSRLQAVVVGGHVRLQWCPLMSSKQAWITQVYRAHCPLHLHFDQSFFWQIIHPIIENKPSYVYIFENWKYFIMAVHWWRNAAREWWLKKNIFCWQFLFYYLFIFIIF